MDILSPEFTDLYLGFPRGSGYSVSVAKSRHSFLERAIVQHVFYVINNVVDPLTTNYNELKCMLSISNHTVWCMCDLNTQVFAFDFKFSTTTAKVPKTIKPWLATCFNLRPFPGPTPTTMPE